VTSKQVENYINQRVDYDLSPVFDQYLRHANIPTLQYHISDETLYYRWDADIQGFDMPVEVSLNGNEFSVIHPTVNEWRTAELNLSEVSNFTINPNFYVQTDLLKSKPSTEK
jgi:hypothetical protein